MSSSTLRRQAIQRGEPQPQFDSAGNVLGVAESAAPIAADVAPSAQPTTERGRALYVGKIVTERGEWIREVVFVPDGSADGYSTSAESLLRLFVGSRVRIEITDIGDAEVSK